MHDVVPERTAHFQGSFRLIFLKQITSTPWGKGSRTISVLMGYPAAHSSEPDQTSLHFFEMGDVIIPVIVSPLLFLSLPFSPHCTRDLDAELESWALQTIDSERIRNPPAQILLKIFWVAVCCFVSCMKRNDEVENRSMNLEMVPHICLRIRNLWNILNLCGCKAPECG